ncbi:hypothetical protein MACH09_35010 [Vibrio sp. MACH09]|uniref:hypothetical protein n=1 Tax=Vibrio sp. MACH09 TaxID=3025122 RepID=UPI002791DC85|nr:hypothetical protein [Vibrio sp. MACH09]GLO62993.1 hypothetical protein MACH09_35010 [Vibrio sp. MACH09]
MSKRKVYDWVALQQEYIQAFNETSITLSKWCRQKGINPNSARKHIRSQKNETDPKCDPKVAGGEREQGVEADRTCSDRVVENVPMMAVGDGAIVTPFVVGNKYAEKHGGYSEIIDAQHFAKALDIPVNSLEAEIVFMRSKLFQIFESKVSVQKRLAEVIGTDKTDALESLMNMQTALDESEERITARIESLQRTAKNNESMTMLDPLKAVKLQTSAEKDKAQTDAAKVMIREKSQRLDIQEKGGQVVYEINW